MNDDQIDHSTPNLAQILAIDRTLMAAERSLMAWVRSTLSMITFGFAFYKFTEFFHAHSSAQTPSTYAHRNFGLALIIIGTVALIIASIQHIKYINRIRIDSTYRSRNLPLVVACLFAFFGLLLIVSIIFNIGPFS